MEQFRFSGRHDPDSTGLFGPRRVRVPEVDPSAARARSSRAPVDAPPPPLGLDEIRAIAERWRRGGDRDERRSLVADALHAVADHRMGALGPKPGKKSVTQRISEFMGLH